VYARSTTVHARRESIDDGIARIRDAVMPAVMDMDGCVGMSLIVDRDSGRCIATTAWDSEGAMRASAEQVRTLRENAAGAFGGPIDRVEQWEIGLLHRDHEAGDGACARCTWLEVDPSGTDDALEAFRMSVLPELERMDGFCSASMFIDRATGRTVSATAWDSPETMDRSREPVNQLRSRVTGQLGARVIEVAEFELVLAHLRVPEMA
jgi:heme-degrading monooxygenase HmoA